MSRHRVPSRRTGARWQPTLALATSLAALPLCPPARSQTPDLCSAASTTNAVQLTVSLPQGRAVFHSGEIVPLRLAFTSRVQGRYHAAVRTYDRSGRLFIEDYCLSPATADPLASYFGSTGVIGGGVGTTQPLSPVPLLASADLNEWHSLPPGRYRLHVLSSRVRRPRDPGEPSPYPLVTETIRSNSVDFQVGPPDPNWQHEQLRVAVQILEGASPPDQKRRAARTIRFLNTAGASRELARLFRAWGPDQPEGGDLTLGLYSTPHRQLAIDSLHDQLSAPSHPISHEFLRTLVDLQLSASPAELPPTGDSPAARQFLSRRQQRAKALWKSEIERTQRALPLKTRPARLATIRTLLGSEGLDESTLRPLRSQLVTAWASLPRDSQHELITTQWPAIAGPEMLPNLRRMAADGAETSPSIRATLLKHIHELDAATGRELILREAANRRAGATIGLLKLLPHADIAGLLPPAVRRIRDYQAQEIDYQLVDAYGQKSDLPIIAAAYAKHAGRWACVPQTAMLRYLLRVDREHATPQVTAALAARKETGCYKTLLEDLGDQLPAVQKTAVAALNDPEADVARNAATALGRWGTADAEAALWTRLKLFHQQWAGRQNDLRPSLDLASAGSQAMALEAVLVTQIAQGAAWKCPPDKLRRLRALVTTPSLANHVDEWIRQAESATSPPKPGR